MTCAKSSPFRCDRARAAASAVALTFVALFASSARPAVPCTGHDARIVVDTAAHELRLCEGGKEREVFSVRLARAGVGKRRAGDDKVPLGTYPLAAPRRSKSFGVFILIGYPTPAQRRVGFTGGGVGVHGPQRWSRWLRGLNNTFDTTEGCVGLATDAEMDRIAAWIRKARAQVIELR
jgi:murein L,D-transpeptidase YafK